MLAKRGRVIFSRLGSLIIGMIHNRNQATAPEESSGTLGERREVNQWEGGNGDDLVWDRH
jgi:hypothetical protein